MTLAAVAALQAALAAEHAAIYGYGVAGAHLSGTAQRTAIRYWTAHRRGRDTLVAMISERGGTPVAPLAYYDLPWTVTNASGAASLAAYLEEGVTRAYLGIVAVQENALRMFGAQAMQSPAERAAYWRGGTTEPFPGLHP